MGVIIPEGEAQISFIFAVAGHPRQMTWTLGCLGVDGGGPLTPTEIANIVHTAWTQDPGATLMPYEAGSMLTNWRFEGVSVSLMTSTGPLVGQNLTSVSGTAVGSSVPINCALLGSKNTGLGGRKYRGRCYIPPIHWPETEIGPIGDINPIVLGTSQIAYNAAMTKMEALGVTPVLHHSDGTIGTPITSITLEGRIATQRRRMR